MMSSDSTISHFWPLIIIFKHEKTCLCVNMTELLVSLEWNSINYAESHAYFGHQSYTESCHITCVPGIICHSVTSHETFVAFLCEFSTSYGPGRSWETRLCIFRHVGLDWFKTSILKVLCEGQHQWSKFVSFHNLQKSFDYSLTSLTVNDWLRRAKIWINFQGF